MIAADRLNVAMMRAIWALATSLPFEHASSLGAAFFLRRAGPKSRKHRLLVRNLRVVFPDWSEVRIEALARDSWAQLGRVIAEFPHFSTLTTTGAGSPVEVPDPHDALARAANGAPALMAGGHLANWELLAGVTAQAGVPLTVVHAARVNPAIELLVERHRRALDCAFLEQGESAHAMPRHIRQGRSIGVLADQRYDKGDIVPFFGRPAFAPMAPAMGAARFGMPFIPVRSGRLAGCRFRVTFEAPLAPDYGLRQPRAIARDLMTRRHERFEAWIRERPDQWLCIKRRWPRHARQMAEDQGVEELTTAASVARPLRAAAGLTRQRQAS